jgi:hypothetical protein
MLDKNSLLEKMKSHFPRWMDIRKRVNTSRGGQLLESIAEEVSESITLAIADYKKDFFIDGYFGREESIIAYTYKAHVGLIDINETILINPAYEITEDFKKFESQSVALYNEGYIYIKESDYDIPVLEYTVETFKMTAAFEKIHVWNVFDEFATFVGITRHEDETNTDLQKRIINGGKKIANSTEPGLKNAILVELSNLIPELTSEDIVIERPTPDNLLKHYKEFGSILEKLAQVNRDVYRTKKWDIDTWKRDFKSIDYIPHAWDIALDAYQNGIGFEDDLNLVLVDSNKPTDVTIRLYEQSEIAVQDFVKNRNLKKNINLKLSKLNNVLNPNNVKYKVMSSEVKDITNEPITIECSERILGKEDRFIQDILDRSKDIQVTDRSNIVANPHKLIFTPESDYGTMEIQCSLDGVNLLKEGNGFVFNNEGKLVYRNAKLYADDRNDYTTNTNVINAQSGVTIDNLASPAKLTLDLKGMSNEFITIEKSCQTTSVEYSKLKLHEFVVKDGNVISNITNDQKYIELEMDANQITFDIVSGSYSIYTDIDGDEALIFDTMAKKFSTPIFDNPKHMIIKITSTDFSPLVLSNFRYSKYEFTSSLKFGEFLKFSNSVALPGYDSNTLTVDMKTFTGYAPVLKFIYIGTSLKNVKYETEVFNGPGKLSIDTNCEITLRELNESSTVISEIKDYQPKSLYTALSDSAYIKLDTSSYLTISGIQTFGGTVETTGAGSSIEYYLKLKKNEKAEKIVISGERLHISSVVNLATLLEIESGQGHKLYANTLLKQLIAVRNDGPSLVKITPAMLSGNSLLSYTIKGMPQDLDCSFVTSSENNSAIIASMFTGSFEYLYLYPKTAKTYIAFNNTNMIKPEQGDIEIVDVFNPFLPINENMVYRVECLDLVNGVMFDDPTKAFVLLRDWSLGHNKLRIKTDIDLVDTENYEISSKSFEKSFELSNVVPLERHYTLSTGEIVELPQYMIELPDNMEIVYKRFNSINPESDPEFYTSETFFAEDDGFNKLKYSNIDELIYIGTTPWNSDPSALAPIPTDDFELLDKEGVIVWNNHEYSNTNIRIYVGYTIKIPSYIKIDYKEMYKAIEYDLSSYKESQVIDLKEIEVPVSGYKVDLSEYIEEGMQITVFCSQPGFEGRLEEKSIVVNRTTASNVAAVKSGYFYMDGNEYYLFGNQSYDSVDRLKNVALHNVLREDDLLLLNKKSNNYIRNSYMTLDNVSEIFNISFDDYEALEGSSDLNSITACDSFNHWKTFGCCELRLVKGLNGLGLQFVPGIENGYAYLDITKYIKLGGSKISFYMQGDMQAYIGKERKVFGLSLTKSTVIDFVSTIGTSSIEPNIYETIINADKDYKYYLIIKGVGMIDDIILQDKDDLSTIVNIHKKNIDHLNLLMDEKIMDDYVARLYLDDNRGSQQAGAEINKEGVIINSSLIDWGITKLKEFDEHGSWNKCSIEKASIDMGVITTTEEPGYIMTEPVFVGNVKAIKNLLFKINDVLFPNMTGFETKLMVSDRLNGSYNAIANFKDNVGYIGGVSLMAYVKLKISMPANKVIDNVVIYVEYKSTAEAAPAQVMIPNGVFLSRVLDSQYATNYKLKSIAIDSVSNINDVAIQIRAAREMYEGDVWSPWKDVKFNSELETTTPIEFTNYRFFQVKVMLRHRDAFIKLQHIDLEVI